MDASVFYIILTAGWFLCVEHVCGSGCGEFPSMSWGARKRGTGETRSTKDEKTCKENWKYVNFCTLFYMLFIIVVISIYIYSIIVSGCYKTFKWF